MLIGPLYANISEITKLITMPYMYRNTKAHPIILARNPVGLTSFNFLY